MQTISENKPVTLKEQKKTLTLALACAKFAPKSQEILKYVPALKLSIMQAEEQKRRESFERSLPDKRQQDLFPNDLPDFNAYHNAGNWIFFHMRSRKLTTTALLCGSGETWNNCPVTGFIYIDCQLTFGAKS